MNPSPSSPLGNYSERGVASWYGVPFHGRRAADGEIYDMYKMTAAHRTLPFDTVVRVTNLANGLHTDVRIIDRGPFVEDRVIDLSLAAARALGMVGTGTAMVTLEVISSSSTSSAPGTPGALVVAAGTFAVQVGAFSDRGNADRLKDQLATQYSPVLVEEFTAPSGHLFRVRVGSLPSIDAAQQLATKLASENGVRTFVVRVDGNGAQ